MSSVALILAEGFEEVEALTPVDLLRRAKIGCDTVSLRGDRSVVGSHGIAVTADKRWEEMDFDAYDGVILPGGLAGTKRLMDDILRSVVSMTNFSMLLPPDSVL